jgi:uroporphyrin-3 C-methyltransferase
VVVHSSTEPVKPLLPPEQHYYLRSNLRLLINQAQLALIDSRQPSYQYSLSQAVQWLNEYFAADDALISAIVVELEQLMKHDISRALPGVEQSLIALKKTHKQRQLAVKLSTENSAVQSSSKTAEKLPASAGKR